MIVEKTEQDGKTVIKVNCLGYCLGIKLLKLLMKESIARHKTVKPMKIMVNGNMGVACHHRYARDCFEKSLSCVLSVSMVLNPLRELMVFRDSNKPQDSKNQHFPKLVNNQKQQSTINKKRRTTSDETTRTTRPCT
jgi:hypothetical protein